MDELTRRLGEILAPRYVIERPIGHGGTATVFLAQDTKLHRAVAIKVLDPALAASLGPERFLREIVTAGTLSHPHILTLLDSGEGDGLLYYTMPYVPAVSLRDRLAKEGQLPLSESLRIAHEVALALEYAHRMGVLHRDVKPENILLAEGVAVLGDFGIARAIDAAATDSLTQTGITIGTPAYMSPEQASGNAELDGRADIYSLGCVLYEMIAGQAPFVGPSGGAVVRQHLLAPVPNVSALRASAGPVLQAILQRALAKSPADRFPSMTEFRRALERAAEDPSTKEFSPAATPALPRPRPRPRRLRLAVLAAVALILAVTVWLAARGWFTGSMPVIHSLAVLPFLDESPGKVEDYFADGMTDALISQLSQIRSLRVISRTSVMTYKGARKSAPEIARELKVDALLEGSVLRGGDRVRITTQLVRPVPEKEVWSQTYEKQLTDILRLQSEVAQAVAREVRVQLTPREKAGLARGPSVVPAAHDAVLKGQYYLHRIDAQGYRTALAEFRRAIELDPTYARAWAGLADAYYFMSNAYLAPTVAIPKAKAAIRRALEIDPSLPEAHTSLGAILSQYDWNWSGAERELRQSLELQPNGVWPNYYYGQLLLETGRPDQSLIYYQRAADLDPLSILVATFSATPYYFSGRYEESVARYREILATDSTYSPAYTWLGLSWIGLGDDRQGLQALERGALLADQPWPVAQLGVGYARTGKADDARRILGRLANMAKTKHVPSYELAEIHAELGESAPAFEALDKAFEAHDEDMGWIKVDPALRSLHSDPRYGELLRRMNF